MDNVRLTRSKTTDSSVQVRLANELLKQLDTSTPKKTAFNRSAKTRRSPVRSDDEIYEEVTIIPRTKTEQVSAVIENIDKVHVSDDIKKNSKTSTDDKYFDKNLDCDKLDKTNQNNNTSNMNNTGDHTLAKLLGKGQAKAISRFHEPPTFHHASSNATTFLHDYDRAALINGWDFATKISYLTIHMVGPAGKWFEFYINDRTNVNKTWDEVKNDIKKKFNGGEDTRQQKYREREQQPYEDIRSYFLEKQMLAYDFDPGYPFDVFRSEFTK